MRTEDFDHRLGNIKRSIKEIENLAWRINAGDYSGQETLEAIEADIIQELDSIRGQADRAIKAVKD